MSTSPKKKVGEFAYEMQQRPQEKVNPIDLQRAVHEGNTSEDSFENQVRIAVDRGKKVYDNDFYVVVLFRKERIKGMERVMRQQFFHRESCPTPEFDQTVYSYNRKEDRIQYIWCIPNWGLCYYIFTNKNALPPEQHELVGHVDDLISGKLDQLCLRLNKAHKKS